MTVPGETSIFPESSFNSLLMIFNNVVFPCPFPPTIPIRSPLRTSSVWLSRTGRSSPSKVLVASTSSKTSMLALSIASNVRTSGFRFFGTRDLSALSSCCIRVIILCFAEIDLSYLLARFICWIAPVVDWIFFSRLPIRSLRACSLATFWTMNWL